MGRCNAEIRNKTIIEICEMRHLYDLPCRECIYHGYRECPESPVGSRAVINHNQALRAQESLREKHKRETGK
jgi:hypothetical protein